MSSNNIDASLSNSDWMKTTWDLPKTIAELQTPFMSDIQFRVYMGKIMQNPIAKAMPESLIKELRAKYGQNFVPRYLDKKPKVEKKDISMASVSTTASMPLHGGDKPKKRKLRTRRLLQTVKREEK